MRTNTESNDEAGRTGRTKLPPVAVSIEPQLVKAATVARMLDMSEAKLYRMIDEGEFPKADIRRPGFVRWHVATVRDWCIEFTARNG